MKTYLSLLLLAILSLSACTDEDPSDTAYIYDIVKLESDSPNGSVFTLSKPGSDKIITLTARQRVDTKKVPVGDRLLLMYVPASGAEAYQSCEVIAKGYGTIVNGVLTNVESAEIEGWDDDAVYLLSAWRAGKYLNIHCRLPYQQPPRSLSLLMPEVQTDASYPDIYLVDEADIDVATFERAYYASFDISSLIEDASVKGFTLHLNNSNLNLDAIRFDK